MTWVLKDYADIAFNTYLSNSPALVTYSILCETKHSQFQSKLCVCQFSFMFGLC